MLKNSTVIALSLIVFGVIILFGKDPNSQKAADPYQASPASGIELSNWVSYQNNQLGFEMSYPDSFEISMLKQDDFEPSLDGTGGIVKFTLAETGFTATTNLREVAVAVGVQAEDGASGCAASEASFASNDELTKLTALGLTETKNLHGMIFTREVIADAGAGNLYNQIIYKASKNNQCFELVIFIHSLNIGNFTPGAVREFNFNSVIRAAAAVLETFKFLN
jgi:hypothetical protein